MLDPKAPQPSGPWQPAYEQRAITDEQIRGLRDRLGDNLIKRALNGDVSAVNACKMALFDD